MIHDLIHNYAMFAAGAVFGAGALFELMTWRGLRYMRRQRPTWPTRRVR